jgi:O-6-methylguanine DNA methyltransferase
MEIGVRVLSTPLGPFAVRATVAGLVSGHWLESSAGTQNRQSAEPPNTIAAILDTAEAWLTAYFKAPVNPSSLTALTMPPLNQPGTTFQCRVWAATTNIPPGQVYTYQRLAERIQMPRAARAVGQALGNNALLLFVPCHRIVGTQGTLTGYAGGIERKRALLHHEGIVM